MSKPVVRLGDLSAGHCFESRPNISGSSNVYINNLPAHRVGDIWPVHTCGDSSHGSVTVGGSSSVLVNGLPLARIGDPLDCGDICLTGSPNVIAGD